MKSKYINVFVRSIVRNAIFLVFFASTASCLMMFWLPGMSLIFAYYSSATENPKVGHIRVTGRRRFTIDCTSIDREELINIRKVLEF